MKPRTQYEETPHVYVRKLGMSTLYCPVDTPTILHFLPHSQRESQFPPPCSQTLRCVAADHGGMRDLKFSQQCCWRFKSPGMSRQVSSTWRSEESSCLYYVGHYSPKKKLSLPKGTRVYTEWCRHRRNVPQVFANQWGYHGIDPLTTNPFARKHCVHTATGRLLFDNMAVYFHEKRNITLCSYRLYLHV